MKLLLGSCFRESAGYHINRYMRQVARLQEALAAGGDRLSLALVWGDSADGTRQELATCCEALGVEYSLTERSHGGPRYGSTEEPARMKALSWVFNGIVEQVVPDADVVAYVESDLLWQPGVFIRLASRLGDGVDVVAPLTFAGLAFYDIWAFRGLDGQRWGPFHPFHPDARFDGELTPVGSVGSCLLMRPEVARASRVRNDNALVGFCEDVRAHGWHICADTAERVEHP